jgi:1-phosphatidylinositol phosphodiesterase
MSLQPLRTKRTFFIFSMLAVSATIFYLFAVFGEGKSAPGLLSHSNSKTATHVSADDTASPLAQFALQKVLDDASPIFGYDQDESSKSATSTWMKAYPDDTLLVHMNIPGTHDAATWNFSKATQQRLSSITALNGIPDIDPTLYRCHDQSLHTMLNDGIRAFDLRYAHDVTNTSLVFWHGQGLQSQTTTLDDLLFAYYDWLEAHPSETLFLSFQYEGNSIPNSANDLGVQSLLHASLTSPAARHYFLQSNTISNTTLGSARGKITLLRRFDLDLLPTSQTQDLPGLHFSPKAWTDNGPNITLSPASDSSVAHIEDYYSPLTAAGASVSTNIDSKLNATLAFFAFAASMSTPEEDSLYWSFASSNKAGDTPPSTPRMLALGNGTDLTPDGGVNNRLKDVFTRGDFDGKRLGIVMFDFYEQPDGLLEAFLGLSPP